MDILKKTKVAQNEIQNFADNIQNRLDLDEATMVLVLESVLNGFMNKALIRDAYRSLMEEQAAKDIESEKNASESENKPE